MPVPLSLDPDLPAHREKAALACRILAMEGLADGVLGDVSVRVGDDRMLIRCRGAEERSVLRTKPDDIRLTSFDGSLRPGADYVVPDELALHGETFRARPVVNAVVHAHPRAVLLCQLAGLPLRPVLGVRRPPDAQVPNGVPVYARATPIRTRALAGDMLDAMGAASVCVLSGHGITVTGATLEQAVVRAVDLNMLAEVILDTVAVGGVPEKVRPADLAELRAPDLRFNDNAAWRALAAKAAHRGLRRDPSPHCALGALPYERSYAAAKKNAPDYCNGHTVSPDCL
jgi:ribulose-5-phosphate 4-epimerase/fuculose-1-phosphate aldolase